MIFFGENFANDESQLFIFQWLFRQTQVKSVKSGYFSTKYSKNDLYINPLIPIIFMIDLVK